MRPRILVADDHPAFLEKLASILADHFDVIATATDGKTALELIRQLSPDVAVLDIDMPELNGLEVTSDVIHGPSDPPVVLCSILADPDIVEAARRAGARGYVFKIRAAKELIEAINAVLRGDTFFSANSNR